MIEPEGRRLVDAVHEGAYERPIGIAQAVDAGAADDLDGSIGLQAIEFPPQIHDELVR